MSEVIQPLHMIEEMPEPDTWQTKLRHFLFDGWGTTTKRAKYLVHQLRERRETTLDDWDGDIDCFVLAKDIGKIIEVELGWPNAHFVPNDPFELVVYPVDGDNSMIDGLEHAAIIRRIERLIGRNLDQENLVELVECSFGEFVRRLHAMRVT